MPSVTCTKIVKETGGRIRVRFGKVEREFASVEAMRDAVRAALTQEELIDLALALMLARQPNLNNPGAFEGRTVSVDFAAANWGTVS